MNDEKALWEENLGLWTQWTSSYTDSMFKAVEKSVDLGTSIRDQIDRAAVEAVRAHLVITLSAIKALDRQVGLLGTKVDRLLQEKE
jgi:hypothetical protein